ncbi:hypothetical protein NEUTE1DRAFT_88950 [Neurospora tetrasperma FGSC 2508]|uniref:Uncharacterized protein n=1 Tax=Neurospora tetrasperma (strain FGSC 2508 / ATCC MYA-4615 / P0657) TaxID=510951 RepID=F8MY06_NEUT8|nr:uncharacterized protein NEUTE1DRAFT_88950 [Neurospora tetrasperma FGSC 2508]EGO51488.1 hypothetical protein NEUTE1DRAFT_88950 [Neurospora tetrasperma FGSC 2508]EGZ78527.1 hypothetical protein NEUTE2DRAFT_102589 [Neurospora tetrasperma FGSC 2509]
MESKNDGPEEANGIASWLGHPSQLETVTSYRQRRRADHQFDTMSKNAAITSFFKPAPRDSQDSQGSSQVPPSSIPRSPIRAAMSPFKMPGTPGTGFKSSLPIRSPVPPPYSPLALLSSPPKPRSALKPVRDRNAVIGASDEEEDGDSDFISSDDDLPDLFAEPKTEVPMSIRANGSPTKGPASKRVASAKFVISPINFNKKHKFDMKAILKHTEADKKIAESEKRVEALMAEDEEEDNKRAEPLAVKKEGTTLHDDMLDMLSEAEDSQEETKKEKLLRAVKRTEATSQRKQWYFFDENRGHNVVDDLSIGFRNKFPQHAATGVWKILAAQKGRTDLLERGVPYHLQCKLRNLPDEIFVWIVDELPFVKTRRLREANLRLLGICLEQAGRLLTPDRITQLFRTIGTPKRCLETPSPSEDGTEQTNPDPGRPYNIDRDWTPLRTVLRILSQTAHGLSIDSLTRSTTLLLRLGMDALIRRNPDLHSTFRHTLINLVEAVPSSSFDAFCLSCCSTLYALTTDSSLLSDALRALPYQTPKLVNLRRRLALAFLFASASTSLLPSPPSLSSSSSSSSSKIPSPIQEFSLHDPSQTFSFPLLLSYFDISPHFQTTRSSSSADYFVLSAQTDLLRISIGDGNPPPPPPFSSSYAVAHHDPSPLPFPKSTTSSSASTTNPETKSHNRQIDLLTRRIRTLWSNIHDQSGSTAEISRLEAKVKLKDLERKLEWAVRTKPVSRTNIFGIRSAGGGGGAAGGGGSGILGGGVGGYGEDVDSEEEREREQKREREGVEQKMFMRRFLGKTTAGAAKTEA